jgi:hypothetical protein
MKLRFKALMLGTALVFAGYGQLAADDPCDSCPGGSCTLVSCNCDNQGGCCLCWYDCGPEGLCPWDDCEGTGGPCTPE